MSPDDPNNKTGVTPPQTAAASPVQAPPAVPAQTSLAAAPRTTASPGTGGTSLRKLPVWTLIPFMVIFLIVFLLTGAWLLLPILIPVGLWYLRAYKGQQNALKAFAGIHGFEYQTMAVLDDLDGVIFQGAARIIGQAAGASSGYLVNWLIRGRLADFNIRMYEYSFGRDGADSNSSLPAGVMIQTGSNKDMTNFAVMDIDVPGEGLQFLLVSRTHPTALNRIGVSLKKYQLEGDFNKYFELYGPDGAEVEILRVFTPDVMTYLIDHCQQYGIELTPQHLFLYRDAGSLSKTVNNLEQMLQDTTNLSTKFFPAIEKVDFSKENITQPALLAPANRSRITAKFSITTTLFISLLLIGIFAGIVFLIKNDAKVPAGYVRADNARVTQDKLISCRSSHTSCSDSYLITAAFTDRSGKSYRYRDDLIRDYSVGTSIDLYYNPSNPVQAKFVGGHSDSKAVTLLAGFFAACLLFIWGAYFLNRKPR